MKMIKYLLIPALSIIFLTNCSWIDGWTHFEIKYSSSVVLPQDLDVNQSKNVYPDQIAADLEGEVESEGYDIDKIESVELDKHPCCLLCHTAKLFAVCNQLLIVVTGNNFPIFQNMNCITLLPFISI